MLAVKIVLKISTKTIATTTFFLYKSFFLFFYVNGPFEVLERVPITRTRIATFKLVECDCSRRK